MGVTSALVFANLGAEARLQSQLKPLEIDSCGGGESERERDSLREGDGFAHAG